MPREKPTLHIRSLLSAVFLVVLVLAATFTCTRNVNAQQPTEQTRAVNMVPAADPNKSKNDNEYWIGPGDQLAIQVFNRAQLSRDLRVDMRGMIRMPLIDEDIRAACRTENELADEIARIYRERQLLKNPAVYVSVKDFQSQPVAVIGAVNSPGKFLLRRRVRLLELLVFHAGGPGATAGRRVQVLSTAPRAACEPLPAAEQAGNADARAESGFAAYDLADVLEGKESANPYIHQGDIINVPAAELAFVVGNVSRPSAIPIVQSITISRALAIAGGTLPNTKKERIRVIRDASRSGTSTEILVDLNATDKSKGVDFPLVAGDIVEVGTKTGFQAILRQLAAAVVPTLTNLPVRVIP
jgi:polysaccharide export outer membrane protein